MENKLIKHIADDILQNNKYLKSIHSNQSIRRLIEGQARKHLRENNIDINQASKKLQNINYNTKL